MTNLQSAADLAMDKLPPKWSIRIDLSRESAEVDLYEPDGDLFEDFCLDSYDGQSIENAVHDAVWLAQQVADERSKLMPDPRRS